MNLIVTEELHGRSNEGLELVEEEAVDLVESGVFERLHLEGGRDFATPPERASSPVSARSLTSALETEVGLLASQQLLVDLDAARARVAERVKRTPSGQPSALEFLGRPYHEAKRNRFLFCEAAEPESYSNNRASGWNDTVALALCKVSRQ
jgi:hypothetical protein